MPEGDTVYRAAAHLDRALRGKALTVFDLRVPRFATSDLTGETVDEVVAVGKHLLHRIGGEWTLHTHLGMDGAWHLYRPGERWRRPRHLARAVLEVPQVVAVGLELPVVELLPRSEEASAVGHLGPDLLGPGWDQDEAIRRIAADPGRELGAALLDQRNLAGLGNEYVVELCFLRGLAPQTTVAEAGPLEPIIELAHRLIRANRDRVERTTTGDTRRGKRTFVYGRADEPCRRCGTPIVRELHGAGSGRGGGDRASRSGVPLDERVSFRCPRCQPLH